MLGVPRHQDGMLTGSFPKEGLLFGLTKRPMFESYTRGIWLENVADEKLGEVLHRLKNLAVMMT